MTTQIARAAQYVSWLPLSLVLRAAFRIRIQGREHLIGDGPCIIAANHIGYYDSFFFRLAIPASTGRLPLRFMGKRTFRTPFLNFLTAIGIVPLLYGVLGVFTVVPGEGLEGNLREAISILGSGGTVVMYPEGKVGKTGALGPLKPGTAVLAQRTQAEVIPVALRLDRRSWPRRKLVVVIGEPFRIPAEVSVEEGTEQLARGISSLL